ncbi:SRPBCC domain-containing protein [Kribbella capetownensis]|uniref:SRPBCC domain-containing protein n=1 Tax=Kribbella capetownensis TaxID=1572659 RepID=A0A4R0JWM5_9ACTN|nr:SRPBCC domain-containing protein [Kribbella capetownensis]TCC49676.1 SRPBCC domain-containing protein [Kribbella capetownensis]
MFTLTQTVDAPPAEVARAFTEPVPFAAWFVADGFTTPADRVTIDARPGGLIAAVFVSADGSSEVPFTIRFGSVDLPRQVVLYVDDPEEVTVELTEAGAGRTRLDYRSTGLAPEQENEVRTGVAHMLGCLATYFK